MAGAGAPSLAAELMLLAVDPAHGGLLPRDRRRFRKALVLAGRHGGRRARPAFLVRLRAARELARRGLVRRAGWRLRLELADRPAAAAVQQRLRRGIREADELDDPRDQELLVLLAWTGILAQRVSRDELRLAARRIRSLGRPGESGVRELPLSGAVPLAESMVVLGAGAAIGLDVGPGDPGH